MLRRERTNPHRTQGRGPSIWIRQPLGHKPISQPISHQDQRSLPNENEENSQVGEHPPRVLRERPREDGVNINGSSNAAPTLEIPKIVTRHIEKYLASRGEKFRVAGFTNEDADFATNPDGTTAIYQKITSPYDEARPFRCSLSRLGIPQLDSYHKKCINVLVDAAGYGYVIVRDRTRPQGIYSMWSRQDPNGEHPGFIKRPMIQEMRSNGSLVGAQDTVSAGECTEDGAFLDRTW
ncbi:MAG: hypothetical protein Q9160_005601 [Pyrenula sp. 1 TL-2023]